MWNNNNSETVGTRGPVLMEDYQLLEKIAQVRLLAGAVARSCAPTGRG